MNALTYLPCASPKTVSINFVKIAGRFFKPKHARLYLNAPAEHEKPVTCRALGCMSSW